MELQTERLKLRSWRDEDLPTFARMNADPIVMQYYPAVMTEQESHSMAQRFIALMEPRGWGFWALERLEDGLFLGFTGLHEPAYDLPVTPCVEIGWRLAKEYWGKGYATEAALACMQMAFKQLELAKVYSFTSVSNHKSRAVMERIGMKNMHQNFEHPMIPERHPLREHYLYIAERESWLSWHVQD